MWLTRPPAVRALCITALTPGVGRFNALSSVAALLMMLLPVAGAAAADGDLRLVEAARNRDQQAVRTLLNQHAEVDVRSHDGATALLWAAHWNDLETADLLIRAGANVNAANDLRITPLSLAAVGTWESGVANPVFGFTDPMSGIPERQAKLQLVKALLAPVRNKGKNRGYAHSPGPLRRSSRVNERRGPGRRDDQWLRT